MCNWNATGREIGAEIIVEDTMANDFFESKEKHQFIGPQSLNF